MHAPPSPDVDLLRFATAGSVDDGKSTLIGRLLYDLDAAPIDQVKELERTAARRGDERIDLSLLTDGLTTEREQGITIDVAYRYFRTGRRKFIVADVPGHEQYTRNMATGASTADAVVILIDAGKGLTRQTRRHLALTALFRARHVIIAVNKMDMVDFAEARFDEIRGDVMELAARLDAPVPHVIPMCARDGDNVVRPSRRMPWYRDAPLLACLEALPPDEEAIEKLPFRLPVQLVQRLGGSDGRIRRRYLGRIEAGTVRVGDDIEVAPSGQHARVRGIRTHECDLKTAHAGMSVGLEVEDELDISRGDVLASKDKPPTATRHLSATICWFADETPDPGRPLLLRHGTRTVAARMDAINAKLDFDTLDWTPRTSSLTRNDVARVDLVLAEPIAADPYRASRRTGSFLLIGDGGLTLGAGILR